MIWMIDMSSEYALWKYNIVDNIEIKSGFLFKQWFQAFIYWFPLCL